MNNIIGTVIGGLLFTFILFLIKEYFLPKKNITGEWKSITLTKSTTYTSYENLSIEFQIHLLQRDNEIIGSGEKIKDILPDGTFHVYETKERSKIYITGYYEKQYLRRSKVYLNIIEKGAIRESRTTYKLVVKCGNKLEGTFQSTAANSNGTINMTKL